MNATQRTLDRISALFWFASGLLVCYRATLLGVGRAGEPGSGFVFFWAGLIMAFLSLVVLAESAAQKREAGQKSSGTNWLTISLVLASLAFYAVVLETAGFLVTTCALLALLLRIGGEARWTAVLAFAAFAALSSFAVFDLWLGIRLPKGALGF